MKLMEWSEKYSVGNATMDAYHHLFFEMVKELAEEAAQGNIPREQLKRRIRFLIDYVLAHFHSEERLMEKIGFPDLDHHCEVHKKFTDDLLDVARRLEDEPDSVSAQDVFTMTMVWLAQHILGEDMKYRPFVETKKLTNS